MRSRARFVRGGLALLAFTVQFGSRQGKSALIRIGYTDARSQLFDAPEHGVLAAQMKVDEFRGAIV
jgi:hypothetical protein